MSDQSKSRVIDHGLNKRPVDHIHLRLAVPVREIHLFAAHHRRKSGKVTGHRPVERDIAKGRLRAPAARRIHPVNKRFNTLFHLAVRKMVRFYKGCKVGVEGGECLRARPLSLHNSQPAQYPVSIERS